MPLPTLLFIALASGFGAALAAKGELRISPRPAVLTRSFAAYALFVGMVLIPVSVYFYAFHGDWFLLYAVDVRRVPSALALVGFLGEAALAVSGFAAGAALVRAQRENVGKVLAGLFLAAAIVVIVVARDRLAVVGTYAQYRGGFGLDSYGSGPLIQGSIAMGLVLAAGLGYLMVRLHTSGNRGS